MVETENATLGSVRLRGHQGHDDSESVDVGDGDSMKNVDVGYFVEECFGSRAVVGGC